MPVHKVIIIGGGIAGIAGALVLTKHNRMSCSVFEIKPKPATIGGAIGLTPKALRYLDHLGVLSKLKPQGCEVKTIDVLSQRTGKKLGVINFDNVERFKHRGLRVMRYQLLQAMLETLEELGVKVHYSMKIQAVVEDQDGITAKFDDGTTVKGDVLLGCDGIHSAVRMKFVQPERKPAYTGIANAYGFIDATDIHHELPVDTTSLYSGQFGSLLLTYTEQSKSRVYFSAVMRANDVGSREGWTVKGQDQSALRDDLLRRFSNPILPFMAEVLQRADGFTLYPVYKLPPNGTWISGRMLLLGDAAHAMPPQGESVGLALEDAILLSRILEHHEQSSIEDLFNYYYKLRRSPVDAAFKEADFGFETIQDRGWIMTLVMEWLTWIILSLRATRKEEEFAFDVRHLTLDP